MQGQFVSSAAPGNFGSPGIYIYNVPSQAITPTGPALGKLGVVGTAQWGPLNTPTLCNSNAVIYANFGYSTAIANSAVRDAWAAMPECNQVVISRIGDGTQVAATMTVVDSSAVTIGTLTAIYTGSLPNGSTTPQTIGPANWSLSLASGTLAGGATGAAPQAKLQLNFPNAPAENFIVVAGTATGGYMAATLRANLAAAINVGSAKAGASVRWTWTSGVASSTSLTLTAGATLTGVATGGVDGATTITNTTLIGTDGLTGRTGIYAMRNAINGGQLILAGYGMASSGDTVPQTLVAFNYSEGIRSGISFAFGASQNTNNLLTYKSANSATDPTLDVFADWLQMTDPWTGVAGWFAPAAKGMGVISSLDYYQAPLNKPSGGGAVGILATERFSGSFNTVQSGEYSARYGAGINYFAKPTAGWALMSDKASDGITLVSDSRAVWFFGLAFMSVFAPFLGQPQTNAINDPTRVKAKAAVNAFMTQQFTPVQKIGALPNGNPAYSVTLDTTNNTPVTVAQGFLNAYIAITTQSDAAIILVQDQIGVNVQLTTNAT